MPRVAGEHLDPDLRGHAGDQTEDSEGTSRIAPGALGPF
jgi:hypothetical protein